MKLTYTKILAIDNFLKGWKKTTKFQLGNPRIVNPITKTWLRFKPVDWPFRGEFSKAIRVSHNVGKLVTVRITDDNFYIT